MDDSVKEKKIPQRDFKTVAEYKEFMTMPQNDDKTQKNNPAPKDGISKIIRR